MASVLSGNSGNYICPGYRLLNPPTLEPNIAVDDLNTSRRKQKPLGTCDDVDDDDDDDDECVL